MFFLANLLGGMMFYRIIASLVALFIMAAPSFAQPRADLSAGGLFLLGGVTLNYGIIDFSSEKQRMELKSDLGGGYFIKDNLAVGFSLPIRWKIMGNETDLGIKPFTTYFFDLGGSVFAYVGGSLTLAYHTFGTGGFRLKAGLDSGVLISMSESVALDFGLRPELTFKLSKSQHWDLDLPAGFFGIRAFF